MQRRALLLGLLATPLAACERQRAASPPSAPRLLSAVDIVPADLDVVVRFDLGRVKAALGSAALSALARELLAAAGTAEHTDQLVLESLLAADIVYLAYRPSPTLAPLDRVLALQGSFEQLVQPPLGFTGAADLGADVRYFERTSRAALTRGGVARIYTASTRVRAFVSEAELDAVERVLATGAAERRLSAPEEGTLSLAARPRLIGRFAGQGGLRDLLDAAISLTAVADVEADGVQLRLELLMAEAEQARRLVAAIQQVLERLGGELAGGVGVELRAEAERVVAALRLQRSQLPALLGCLRAGSGSDCPW